MTENQQSEPGPTRPTWKMALIVAVIILVAAAATHWDEVSAFAHLPEIEHSLGIG